MSANSSHSKSCQHCAPPSDPPRRNFIKKFIAFSLGGLSTLVPAGTGLIYFMSPALRKNAASGTQEKVLVGTLASLPEEGIPKKFSIIANRSDAWNRYPSTPIGAVYLRRTADNKVEAVNVLCPHAGCYVSFNDSEKGFLCPCHDSTFNLDGSVRSPSSPSPRGLDHLEVEIRNDSEIWVRFQNFQRGHKEKIPLA